MDYTRVDTSKQAGREGSSMTVETEYHSSSSEGIESEPGSSSESVEAVSSGGRKEGGEKEGERTMNDVGS